MGLLDDPILGLKQHHTKPKAPKVPKGCVLIKRAYCPYCGSSKVPVYDSHEVPLRRHKCKQCQRTFTSWEEGYRPGAEQPDDPIA